MVNDQGKSYTIKELTEILNTVDNVVRKKVKKHRLTTTQEMVNSRLTTLVKLSDTELEALIKEIEFNKTTYKPENDHLGNSKQPVRDRSQNHNINDINANLLDNIESTDQYTGNRLVEMLAQYAEKAGKYELLEDKSKEDKDNVKFWQDKYFESQNENKDLIKLNAELTTRNEQLKSELDTFKNRPQQQPERKSGFMGLFKK